MTELSCVTLETERLILRKQTLEDAEMMFLNCYSDPKLTKYMMIETHTTLDESKKVLKKAIKVAEQLNLCRWGIILKENGQMIGQIKTVSVDKDEETIEVNCAVSSSYWDKGIAAEALKKIIDFLFSEIGVKSVWSSQDVDNPKYGKILIDCGMEYFRDSFGRTSLDKESGVHRDYIIRSEEYFAKQSA